MVSELFEKFKEEFEMVSQFQGTFDPVVESNGSIIRFRSSLITEEGVTEFNEAYINSDRVKIVDSVCDTLYVVLGAYVKLGIPFVPLKEGEIGEFRHSLEYYLERCI